MAIETAAIMPAIAGSATDLVAFATVGCTAPRAGRKGWHCDQRKVAGGGLGAALAGGGAAWGGVDTVGEAVTFAAKRGPFAGGAVKDGGSVWGASGETGVERVRRDRGERSLESARSLEQRSGN